MGEQQNPVVGVVMGSSSDMQIMGEAIKILLRFSIPFEAQVTSAHRTPHIVEEYARTAARRGLKYLIAGAGGSAHLPGMLAAQTMLPVHGVAVPSSSNNENDRIALDSMIQMPAGVPVAVFGIGKSAATNAALQAVRGLAVTDKALAAHYTDYVSKLVEDVLGRQREELYAFVENLKE